MTFSHQRSTVTDVAALVLTGSPDGSVLVRNIGTDTAYLGGSGVTPASGLPVEANELLSLAGVNASDELFAVCSTGQTTELALLARLP